jgi:hypothetical protein
MCSIQEDNQKHLNRFKNVRPNPSYIAGFIDGDGCIFIRKIKDGYQSGISISQSRTNILQIIRFHFGGSITSSINRNSYKNDDTHVNNLTKRNQYNLMIRSNQYNNILDYIKESIVLKEPQIKCLLDFSKLCNKMHKNDEKEKLYEICKEFNNKDRKFDDYNFIKLNIEYIAGLFDAEGCIYICKSKFSKIYVKLTQKNHPAILYKIKDLLGYGNVYDNNNFKIESKQNCIDFLNKILPHLIVKYNQAEAFIKFVNTKDNNIKQELYSICNKEKHEVEEFYDLNSSSLQNKIE